MRADIHDGSEHHTLQSEAGYIDARPHQPGRRNLLHRTAGPYFRVKPGKAQSEYMFSGLPPAPDIRQRGWHVGSVPGADVSTWYRSGKQVLLDHPMSIPFKPSWRRQIILRKRSSRQSVRCSRRPYNKQRGPVIGRLQQCATVRPYRLL
jgi:hypothetical protein